METKVRMKNEIISFFQSLGLTIPTLINGFVGGVVYSLYRKSKFWESVRQVFVGGLVSGYVTPVVAEKFDLKYVGFLSFVLGIIGMVFVDILYKWAVKKAKNYF